MRTGNDIRMRGAGVLLAVALLAGCGGSGGDGGGTSTDCSLTGCEVTLDRGVDQEASILGVGVRLVDVTGDQATLEVGGQQVQLQVDQSAQVAGFDVRLLRLTDQEAVVEISRGGGEG